MKQIIIEISDDEEISLDDFISDFKEKIEILLNPDRCKMLSKEVREKKIKEYSQLLEYLIELKEVRENEQKQTLEP